MRKLVLLLTLPLLFSCGSNTNNTVMLSGKVDKVPECDYVYIVEQGARGIGNELDSISVNSNGAFSASIVLGESLLHTWNIISYNTQYQRAFFKPGGKLDITFEKGKKPVLTGCPEWDYAIEKPKRKPAGHYELPFDDFMKEIEANYAFEDSCVKSIKNKYPEYSPWLKENYRLSEYYSMINSFWVYPSVNKNTLPDNLNEYEKEFTDMIDFSNKELLSINDYTYAIFNFVNKPARKIWEEKYNMEYSIVQLRFERILNQKMAPEIRDYLMYKSFSMGLNSENITELPELLDVFVGNVYDKGLKEKMSTSVEEAIVLGKGMDAPLFRFENIEGEWVSLDDLRGKYLYIDVWATWCGPCNAQTPSFIKLKKELENENIEFVTVSIDTENKKEYWRDFAKKKGLNGMVNLIAGDQSQKFMSDYMAKSVPHFILIDDKGKMVKNGCPRPFEKGMADYLRKAMEQ